MGGIQKEKQSISNMSCSNINALKPECIGNINLTDLSIEFANQIAKKQDEIFEYALRNNAVPPIKGELTKGKIKWRGIVIITQQYPTKCITYLSQRGNRISETFELYNFEIDKLL